MQLRLFLSQNCFKFQGILQHGNGAWWTWNIDIFKIPNFEPCMTFEHLCFIPTDKSPRKSPVHHGVSTTTRRIGVQPTAATDSDRIGRQPKHSAAFQLCWIAQDGMVTAGVRCDMRASWYRGHLYQMLRVWWILSYMVWIVGEFWFHLKVGEELWLIVKLLNDIENKLTVISKFRILSLFWVGILNEKELFQCDKFPLVKIGLIFKALMLNYHRVSMEMTI